MWKTFVALLKHSDLKFRITITFIYQLSIMESNSAIGNSYELQDMMAKMRDLNYHFEGINAEERDLLIQHVSSVFNFFEEGLEAA